MFFCLLLEWLPCLSVKRFHTAFQRNDYTFSPSSSKFQGEYHTVLQIYYFFGTNRSFKIDLYMKFGTLRMLRCNTRRHYQETNNDAFQGLLHITMYICLCKKVLIITTWDTDLRFFDF